MYIQSHTIATKSGTMAIDNILLHVTCNGWNLTMDFPLSDSVLDRRWKHKTKIGAVHELYSLSRLPARMINISNQYSNLRMVVNYDPTVLLDEVLKLEVVLINNENLDLRAVVSASFSEDHVGGQDVVGVLNDSLADSLTGFNAGNIRSKSTLSVPLVIKCSQSVGQRSLNVAVNWTNGTDVYSTSREVV